MQMNGLKGDPSLIKWNVKANGEMLSMVINNKSLLLNSGDMNSIELNFDTSYGQIVDYCFYKEMIVIGFTKGYLVAVSTSIFD